MFDFDDDESEHHQRGDQPGSTPAAMTVSELSGHLKAVVEQTFPPLWVVGEVTDVAKPRSGHIYFSLKDDDSQIRAVIWRNTASRLGFDLENGQSLICLGNLEVYTVRGTYQLVIRKAQPQGQGALQKAYEQLRNKLKAEGLFDSDRKQTLPEYPRRIGIITSPTGAAVRDFLVAATGRMLGAEVFVIPAQVQGDGAAATIQRGLRAAEMIRPQLDVVVLARGGGSLEDLWTFNEESVVRAIAACPLPTVSAIGHEVDVTLSDLVADERALTPTDAAGKVFPERTGMVGRVNEFALRLNRAISRTIEIRKLRLENLENSASFRKPLERIHDQARQLDEFELRARNALDRKLEISKANLTGISAQLGALSPLNTLSRGYSVTVDQQGDPVIDSANLSEGDVVTTRLHRGKFQSKINRIERSLDE